MVGVDGPFNQVYVLAPEAVNVTDSPLQIFGEAGLIVKEMAGFTVTEIVDLEEQPSVLVPITE